MTADDLASAYRAYLDCLNRQDWPRLGDFVDDSVTHNGRPLGVAGYRAMLEQDYRDIPDLRFIVEWLVCEAPLVASRLVFTCTPRARFMGLDVNGRTVTFREHVFYRWQAGRIVEVRSVIDKAAIQAQL
ncbi:ester cyclase [Pseudomonas sp. TE3610]